MDKECNPTPNVEGSLSKVLWQSYQVRAGQCLGPGEGFHYCSSIPASQINLIFHIVFPGAAVYLSYLGISHILVMIAFYGFFCLTPISQLSQQPYLSKPQFFTSNHQFLAVRFQFRLPVHIYLCFHIS